jgi:hypothetical protein
MNGNLLFKRFAFDVPSCSSNLAAFWRSAQSIHICGIFGDLCDFLNHMNAFAGVDHPECLFFFEFLEEQREQPMTLLLWICNYGFFW